MYYESIPPVAELEANLDYVKCRSKFLGDLLDALLIAKPDLEKFGINPTRFHPLLDHVSEELLGSETEKQILENDIAKERFLANE